MSLLSSLKKTANGIVATFKDGSQSRIAIVTVQEKISGTMSGFSSGGTYSGIISRIGNQVTLNLAATGSGTRNTLGNAGFSLPVAYRPTTSAVGGCLNFSTNGNVRSMCQWAISSGGDFLIYGNLQGGDIPNTAGCGFNEPVSVSWNI